MGTKDAPSVKAMARIGKEFKESDSDSMAMVVVESDKTLGQDAHRYYDALIKGCGQTRRMCSTSRTSGATR